MRASVTISFIAYARFRICSGCAIDGLCRFAFRNPKNHPDQIQRHQRATEAEHGEMGITKKWCCRGKHQRDQNPKYLDLTLRSDEQGQNYGGHIDVISEVAGNDKIKGVDTAGRFERLCSY